MAIQVLILQRRCGRKPTNITEASMQSGLFTRTRVLLGQVLVPISKLCMGHLELLALLRLDLLTSTEGWQAPTQAVPRRQTNRGRWWMYSIMHQLLTRVSNSLLLSPNLKSSWIDLINTLTGLLVTIDLSLNFPTEQCLSKETINWLKTLLKRLTMTSLTSMRYIKPCSNHNSARFNIRIIFIVERQSCKSAIVYLIKVVR